MIRTVSAPGFCVAALCANLGGQGACQVLQKHALGGTGGWDLVTVDPATHRLFISRSDRVMVVDAASGKLLGEIPGTQGVHAIALAPELGKGYTSNGRSNSVTVFDLATLKVTGEIGITGKNPDVILYEPTTRRIFTFNGGSEDASVIDTAKGAEVGTIPMNGRPELAVADGQGKVYVNLEDKSQVLRVDVKTSKVEATWSLAPGEEPTGLALDPVHARLFAVCANQLMVVLDAASGRRVATVPIGKGPDGVAYDGDRGLIFSSNGEGTLTIVHEDDKDHFKVVGTVPTQKSARTVALDPGTHRLYLPAAEFSPAAAPTPEQPHPRPVMVPGSFTVLVVGPK